MPTFIKAGFWEKAVKGFKGWLDLDQWFSSLFTPALWWDLSSLLVEDLHGSFSFPAQARRAAASSSAPPAHPPTGVG